MNFRMALLLLLIGGGATAGEAALPEKGRKEAPTVAAQPCPPQKPLPAADRQKTPETTPPPPCRAPAAGRKLPKPLLSSGRPEPVTPPGDR